MTDAAQALNIFFNGFGIPAYLEYDVPEDAKPPYITYQLIEPEWRQSATMYARLWYRSRSTAAIDAKVKEIKQAIGDDGVSLPTDDGAVWLFRGNPFAQHMRMPGDDGLRAVYLNLIVHALTDG